MSDGGKGYVFRALLARNALAELLAAQFDQAAVAVVRRVDWAEFVSFNPAEADALLESWTEGRLFDSRSEVRWRATDGTYDVLLLTEQGECPLGFGELGGAGTPFDVVHPSSDDAHGFLLWGTDSTPAGFIETRIPRLLKYPADVGQRMRLAYKLYERNETVCWVRLSV